MELNFNSVETIPVLNASAAFKTDSGKLHMSDYDMGDGGHVFGRWRSRVPHLLSRSAPSEKEPPAVAFSMPKRNGTGINRLG